MVQAQHIVGGINLKSSISNPQAASLVGAVNLKSTIGNLQLFDQNKRPLDPIHPAQARQLLRNKKAAIYRQFPFTLILKESRHKSPVSTPDAPLGDTPSLLASPLLYETLREGRRPHWLPLRLKIDPGAKTTGIALVNDATGEVVFAAELKHRGFAIRDALTSRRVL